MEIYMLGLLLIRLLLCQAAALEETQYNRSQSLKTRQGSWTDLAWQTSCNNIDYLWEDCCNKKSGSSWHSCNSAGFLTVSNSGVLCYSLDEGHDCCADSSVCDKALGCCDGTCCQTKTSVTICSSGCISRDGRGCDSLGNCKHGIDNISTASTTGTGGSLSDGETSSAATPATSSTGETNHNECGTGENNQGSVSCIIGGKSSAPDKLGLGLGLGLGVPTLAVAVLTLCA